MVYGFLKCGTHSEVLLCQKERSIWIIHRKIGTSSNHIIKGNKSDIQTYISQGFFYMRNPEYKEHNKRCVAENMEKDLSQMVRELRDREKGEERD